MYGHISKWDTSAVDSFKNLFRDCATFTGDVSNWQTSSVTSMHGTFYNAAAFNGDLSKWQTEQVRCAHAVCHGCLSENVRREPTDGSRQRWARARGRTW